MANLPAGMAAFKIYRRGKILAWLAVFDFPKKSPPPLRVIDRTKITKYYGTKVLMTNPHISGTRRIPMGTRAPRQRQSNQIIFAPCICSTYLLQ